jgi:hypothetical protein
LYPCHNRSSGQTQIVSSRCIVCRLPESSNSYMWLQRTFLSYPTTFLACKRTISSCLLATIEVVDRPKSYLVDVLCVDYPSHMTLTCGYEVLFYLIPLLSLLVRELYHLVSMPQRKLWTDPNVLCVDYTGHLTVTCGYEVLFYLIPLLSLHVIELYHLVFMPQKK